jgi:hypothetical protein
LFSKIEGIGGVIALAGLPVLKIDGLDLQARGELPPEVKRGVPSSLGKGEIKDGDPSNVLLLRPASDLSSEIP